MRGNITVNQSVTPMGDTIKTEEGVPLEESVRFENEPWTPLYLTGEVVREFRKALRSKSRTGRNAAKRLGDYSFDQEASSRMDNEGCPNEPGHLL
jgi:hypothetical protein